MEQYVIKGGNPLVGEVEIAGAKNAALAILAAAIMTDETILIENLPDVRDINVLLEAMQNLEKSMISKLIETAMEQLKFSYTPYSNFKVGASLLTKNGQIYTGCNIENAAYTPTNCAERTAIFKAVSEGVREFDAICIVGGKDGILTEYTAPCGVCRQVMMEFCDPETFRIILAIDKEHYDIYTLKDLLPLGFGPRNLTNSREI